MKASLQKIAAAAMLALAPCMAAQTHVLQSMATANPEDINYRYITNDMLRALEKTEGLDDVPFLSQCRDLTGIELLTINSDSLAEVTAANLREYSQANRLKQLSQVKGDSRTVVIYGRPSANRRLSELILMTRAASPQLSAVILTGDIDPDALEGLSGALAQSR